jgi:tetratricopeptide (TPR) repeat protein
MPIPRREPHYDEAVASAEKLVAKGKITSAIDEYQAYLHWNPNNWRTQNRIGDLYLRIGNTKAAVAVFDKMAQHFEQDGFFLRAIAIRKKINKVDPANVQTHEQLASLYSKQGLAIEALAHWRALAAYHEKTGNLSELERIRREIHKTEAYLTRQNAAAGTESPPLTSSDEAAETATSTPSDEKSLASTPATVEMAEEPVKITPVPAPTAGLPVVGIPVMHTSADIAVFLCHASDDKPAVRELYERLQGDHFQPWLDEEDLLPGQNWQQEIPRAVRRSHVVMVCLSSRSVTKAGYLQKEIKFALDVLEEQPEGIIFVIPARLEPCDVPASLSHLHYVDLFNPQGYAKLKRALDARAQQLGFVSSR